MKDFQPGRDTGSAGSAPADIDFEAEHRPEVSRRASNAALRRYIQKQAISGASLEATHEAAAKGVASPTTSLPFADKIQSSFGPSHDVSQINAHVGGDSASAMGANAYASGNHVVFDKSPDLHTAAHEAAHVVQQAQGVNLYGGVGEAGDSYERHADAVADRVVAGQSAADLLGPSSGMVGQGIVQKKADKNFVPSLPEATTAVTPDEAAHATTTASSNALLAAITLATKRIHVARHAVQKKVAEGENEAGVSPKIPVLEKQESDVEDDVRRIWLELNERSLEDIDQKREIARVLFPLAESVGMFYSAYDDAKRHVEKGNEKLAGDFDENSHIERGTLANLKAVHQLVNAPFSPTPQLKKEDDPTQNVHSLETTSFFRSLTALSENGALAARNDGAGMPIETIFARAQAHADEVEALLPIIPSRELRDPAHRGELTTALTGIDDLRKILANYPKLGSSHASLATKLQKIVAGLHK